MVFSEMIAWMVPDGSVPDGAPFDRTGGVVSPGGGGASATSSAPISQPAPCGRGSPSMSPKVTLEILVPQSIAQASDGSWLLARDLEAARFFDLYRDLGLAIETEDADGDEEAWQTRLREIVRVMQRAEAEILGLSVKELLRPDESKAQPAKIEAVPSRERSSGAAE